MKNKGILIVLSAAFALISCTPKVIIASETPSIFPTATISTSTIAAPLVTPTEFPQFSLTRAAGFVDDWRLSSMLMPTVREYFYYRKKAVISGDVNVLWARYPGLKDDINVLKGINAERFFIDIYQALKPFDGNVNLQVYERVRVKMKGEGDEAETLVHGTMIFLWIDENGDFQDTGGEIEIVLFLRRDGEKWTVYRTDEYRLGE